MKALNKLLEELKLVLGITNMAKEKFVITPEDQKYMDSIGNPRTPEHKLVRTAKAKTHAIKAKMQGGTKGRSHFSGRTYNHE